MLSKFIEIRKAKVGRGLFTKKNFKKGQILFKVKGKIVRDGKAFLNLSKKERDNCFRFDSKHYLLPTNEIGDFLNHSCNPNSAVKKRGRDLFVFAIKSIKKDEVIVMDYSTIIADDDYWKMKCACNEKECRKVIGKFSKFSEDKKRSYIVKRIVPRFILNINKSLS